MEIIALQQYTDKYVSLYEGEIRNLEDRLATQLIEKDIVAEHNDSSGDTGGGGTKASIMIQCNEGGFEKGYNEETEETTYYTYSELMALYEQYDGQLIGCWNDTSHWPFEPMSPVYNDEGVLKWRCLFFDSLLPGADGHIVINEVEMRLYDTDENQCIRNRWAMTAPITQHDQSEGR